MKKWEAEKVNELYKEIDILKEQLKTPAPWNGCNCDCAELAEDVKKIKEVLENLDARVQVKKTYK